MSIRVFFGKPGCGKSTLCCKFARQNATKRPTYINFANTVPKAYPCTLDGLGEWTPKIGAYLLIDESGIEFNSRAYKALPKPTIAWFKKHRHFHADVDVFSQSHEDMDITIRRLADELWYMKKVGWWTICRRIYKYVMVDENTHQIIDGYKMACPLWLLVAPLQFLGLWQKKYMLTFRPFYYRYFNSWEVDETIPVREFIQNK